MTMALHRRPERLDHLVEECLVRVGGRKRPITRQFAAALPDYPMDRDLIKEALDCLIREALFRAAAAARLRVTVKSNRNALMFAVKAPGAGLTDEQREGLFLGEPRPGTLARARAIVAAHGGVTWANGLPGKGVTYYLSLPIRRPAPEA